MNPVVFAPLILLGLSFVFSILGRGGGTLYIPLLFWLGMDLKTGAIPLSLMLAFMTSSFAALTYGRKGVINWKVALPFGFTMIGFAPLGALVNSGLPNDLLLIVLVIFTALSVIPIIFSVEARDHGFYGSLLLGFFGGSSLGFLAGLIGRGGGSFIVPLLYLMGISAKPAVAISAFVVTCSTGVSLISHLSLNASPTWYIWIPSAAAVLIGSRFGSKLGVERLSDESIRYLFIAINLGAALLLLTKDVLNLF